MIERVSYFCFLGQVGALMNTKCSLSDLYFIFADNVYENTISDAGLRALINFYALFYDHVLIPDAFFVNNSKLLRLIGSQDGIGYLKHQIIVPIVRDNAQSLTDIYKRFDQIGTLSASHKDKLADLSILEKVPMDYSVRWRASQIAGNFTQNVIANMDHVLTDDENKKKWLDLIVNDAADHYLTRQFLHRKTNEVQEFDEQTKDLFKRYVDVIYNFNIPNYFHTSAAYPEFLKDYLEDPASPDQVFFNNRRVHQQMQQVGEKRTMSTSLFNEGILSTLNADQILHMRRLPEHKKLIKAFRKMGSIDHSHVDNCLCDFIMKYEDELPRIVDKSIAERIKKEKMKLRLQTMATGTVAEDGAGLAVDGLSSIVGVTLNVMESFAGAKTIGQLIQIVTRPFTKKTRRNIRKLDFQGKYMVERLKNDQDIYDTMHSFSLNSLKK